MQDLNPNSGADFKGAPSPAATQPHGAESKLVIGFIIVAVLVIAALVAWAM